MSFAPVDGPGAYSSAGNCCDRFGKDIPSVSRATKAAKSASPFSVVLVIWRHLGGGYLHPGATTARSAISPGSRASLNIGGNSSLKQPVKVSGSKPSLPSTCLDLRATTATPSPGLLLGVGTSPWAVRVKVRPRTSRAVSAGFCSAPAAKPTNARQPALHCAPPAGFATRPAGSGQCVSTCEKSSYPRNNL